MSDEDDIRATRGRAISDRLVGDMETTEENLFERDTADSRRQRQDIARQIDEFSTSDDGLSLIPDVETDPIAGIEHHSLSDLFPVPPPQPRTRKEKRKDREPIPQPVPPLGPAPNNTRMLSLATWGAVEDIQRQIRPRIPSYPEPNLLDQAGSMLNPSLTVTLYQQDIRGFRAYWRNVRVNRARPGAAPSGSTARFRAGWARANRAYSGLLINSRAVVQGIVGLSGSPTATRYLRKYVDAIIRRCSKEIDDLYRLHQTPEQHRVP